MDGRLDMNYKMMGNFIGRILAMEAIFMLPALIISMCVHSTMAVKGFAISIAITALVAFGLLWFGHKAERKFYAKEGLVCVSASWILISIFGCLPFVISGEIPKFIDALFEMVSGFTTTGASIVPVVEELSAGILYWRSFSHWIGGMGVLVFLLAITSVEGNENGFTMHLLRAESPGPDVGKLVPKMRTTASILYWMYIVLTVIDIGLLLFSELSVLEAVCLGLGTAGTGGFGLVGDSFASYSPYVQNVTTIFMLLFGVNFSCYYLLLVKRVKDVLKDEELRFYLALVAGSIALIVWNLRGYYGSFGETLRHAGFQVASIISTTGYASTDFDQWPNFSKTILLCLMLVGACAGSTAGGFKCSRAVLLMKNAKRSIRKVVRPQKVQVVRYNGRPMEEKVLQTVNSYAAIYVIILVGSFFLISIDGYSIASNISAVFSCLNNIGPGLEAVGPMCNYSGYSVFSKIVLILDMLIGRLEIFPMLILLSRSTWKRK